MVDQFESNSTQRSHYPTPTVNGAKVTRNSFMLLTSKTQNELLPVLLHTHILLYALGMAEFFYFVKV